MILTIDGLISPERAEAMREALANAAWHDGRETAGYQSALAKDNLQLRDGDPLAVALGAEVLAALDASLLFQSAALPAALFPPLFSRYRTDQSFGTHVDNAYRPLAAGGRIRTDLSATLFLSDPRTYDGGELLIEDGAGERAVKLPAGSLVLYPATTLHRVAPVTRGERLAAVFWVQSLVPDAGRRSILFDIDLSIQSLRTRLGEDDPALVALTGAYHNLLRQWGR
ncbi:MAG TPA: Fe2+-dependent dioxygenase [Allosphingosinicella sp.]|jgi:PKHD-type hydroxylase